MYPPEGIPEIYLCGNMARGRLLTSPEYAARQIDRSRKEEAEIEARAPFPSLITLSHWYVN